MIGWLSHLKWPLYIAVGCSTLQRRGFQTDKMGFLWRGNQTSRFRSSFPPHGALLGRAAVASSVWISGKKASQTHHSVDEAGRCRSELYLSEQFTLVHGNCFGNAYVSSRQKCIQKVCSMIGFPVPNSYLCPERAPNKNEQSAFAVFANSYFCRKAVAKTIMGAKERANQEKTKGQENSDATTREKLLGQVLTRRMCR